MMLNVDAILRHCPQKLLTFYPTICAKIAEAQDLTADEDVDGLRQFRPLGLLVHGSRNSGKSEFFIRSVIALMGDGYARRAKFATITERGLIGCKDAIEQRYPLAVGSGTDGGNGKPMNRRVHGGVVDFDFFGKTDVKTEQKKYDILVCEEVEGWNESGVKALETEIRHCSVIVLISNNPPLAVREFCKSHNFEDININYWDNPALPLHIKEAYDKAKSESPGYYSRFVLCSDEAPLPRWFDASLVEQFLTPVQPNLTEVVYAVNGIDVGAGTGGDESAIVTVRQTRNHHIFVDVVGKFQFEALALSAQVGKVRAATRSDEEVWDAQGIGLSVLQTRAPNAQQRRALGIVEFREDGGQAEEFFNNRSEAYGIWQDLILENRVHYSGEAVYIDEIRQEMNAQQYYDGREGKATVGKRRLAPKHEIKRFMNGHSPNVCDAIAIAIWRAVKRPTAKRANYTSGSFTVKGTPSL